MSHLRLRTMLTTALAALALAGPADAKSNPACGNLDLTGATAASCVFATSGGCTSQCTPVSCTASLTASCMGSISGSCTASCTGDCMATCSADPGSYDCTGDCTATCKGDCTTECASNADQTTCIAQCHASCEDQCDVSCTSTPPSASCDAQCKASCNGSCDVKANLSCEESAKAACTGGCKTQCSSVTGALFCDLHNGDGPQYVDVSAADLPACAKSLGVSVTVVSTGSCSGDECSASVSAKGCSLAPGGSDAPVEGWLAGLGVVLAAAMQRRKRG